jgi:hypothetical protein
MKQLLILMIPVAMGCILPGSTVRAAGQQWQSLPAFIIPTIHTLPAVTGSRNGRVDISAPAMVRKQRMGLMQRATFNLYEKKLHKRLAKGEEINPADRKAKNSMILGITALVLALIPWYTILAAIPLGIIAIVNGQQAKKMGAKRVNGTGFGIAALGVVLLWVLISALVVTALLIGG